MALAGLALAAVVWVSWPDEPTRVEPAAEPQPIVRVLAAVEPDSSADGPSPVPSDADLDAGYVQETPEELGAAPLPGADVTPEPPPAAG